MKFTKLFNKLPLFKTVNKDVTFNKKSQTPGTNFPGYKDRIIEKSYSEQIPLHIFLKNM